MSVYVAFDASGRHYAYAADPENCEDFKDEQKREIKNLRRTARRKGGKVLFLSSEEYHLVVLKDLNAN